MPSITTIPLFQRPREKLIEKGPSALKEYELLAILLRTGYQGKSALELAKRILRQYPLPQLIQLPIHQLAKLKGIGYSRASTIIASVELFGRINHSHQEIIISSPQDVYKTTYHLANHKKEHLHLLCLNARNQLINQETISIGTITTNISHPREIFYPAITSYAVQIILVHNHPSGDTRPSKADIEMTKQVIKAGEILDIEIIDHIIISPSNYYSLKEEGDM